MCCLFGLIDYGHSLSRGQRTRLLIPGLGCIFMPPRKRSFSKR